METTTPTPSGGQISESDWDIDDVVADVYHKGQTDRGNLVAEFGSNNIVVGESAGAIINFLMNHR